VLSIQVPGERLEPGETPVRVIRDEAIVAIVTTGDMSYEEVRRRSESTASRRRRLDHSLPPHRRERLRSETEAEVLRRHGTPEDLVGPVGSDEEVARQWAELVTFARELRARAGRAS
jgi:hypothetical protein